ncbi:MAG: hypothetical protein Q9200_003726 [Gallowayella weberi]
MAGNQEIRSITIMIYTKDPLFPLWRRPLNHSTSKALWQAGQGDHKEALNEGDARSTIHARDICQGACSNLVAIGFDKDDHASHDSTKLVPISFSHNIYLSSRQQYTIPRYRLIEYSQSFLETFLPPPRLAKMRTSILSPFALLLLTPLTHAYTGDLTYYDPGLGSCGIQSGPNDHIVALSREIMQNGANPNANPKCGSMIGIWNPHTKTKHEAKIVDTCVGCKTFDIDVSPALFKQIAPSGDGRVHGINWGGNKVGG